MGAVMARGVGGSRVLFQGALPCTGWACGQPGQMRWASRSRPRSTMQRGTCWAGGEAGGATLAGFPLAMGTTPSWAPWAPGPLHAAAPLPRRSVETQLLSLEPRSSLTWPSDGAAPGSLSEPPASGPGPSRKLDGTRPRCPFSSPWGGDAGETRPGGASTAPPEP